MGFDGEDIFIFKKLIAKLVESRVPYKVNMGKLSMELGISHPTLSVSLDILKTSKVFHPIKKYSTKVSKKPAKLLFENTNILHAYADEFGVEVNRRTAREKFFTSDYREIFYSDIGDPRIKDRLFEIGGRSKTFKQIKDIEESYLVIDTDYTTEIRKIPLWLFGLICPSL